MARTDRRERCRGPAMDASDVARLSAWLGAPLVVEDRAASGSSNVTWLVRWADRAAVLRHPPRDRPVLPTAHDLLREATVMDALADTSVPVPEVLAVCPDPAVLGVPFVLAARCPGCCLLEQRPAAMDPAALARAAVDTLAAVHAVDVAAIALEAAPGSYLTRQIDRWRRQLASTPTAPRLGDLAPIVEWLQRHCPAHEERTLVHGDYGFHNLLVSDARVEAVLDWELATLGYPIADLFSFLKSWGPGAAAPNPANDAVSTHAASPTKADLLARYEDVTGRPVARHATFYEAFSLWRSVGILEGIHSRTDGARFGDEVPALVASIAAMIGTGPR